MTVDLLAAATPRPWRAGPFDTGRPRGVCAWVFAPPGVHPLDRIADCGADIAAGRADAALIVAAVNEYEALLDLEEAVLAYRARLDSGEAADEEQIGWALARLDAVRNGS